MCRQRNEEWNKLMHLKLDKGIIKRRIIKNIFFLLCGVVKCKCIYCGTQHNKKIEWVRDEKVSRRGRLMILNAIK